MADQEQPFNPIMQEAFKKAAESGKTKRFPDYKGGNPNTPDEIVREFKEQGVVKTGELTKEDAGKILGVVKDQMNKQATDALIAEQATKEQAKIEQKEVIGRDIKLGEDEATDKPIKTTSEFNRAKLEAMAKKRNIFVKEGASLAGLASVIEQNDKNFWMESGAERKRLYDELKNLEREKRLLDIDGLKRRDYLIALHEAEQQITDQTYDDPENAKSTRRKFTEAETQELADIDRFRNLLQVTRPSVKSVVAPRADTAPKPVVKPVSIIKAGPEKIKGGTFFKNLRGMEDAYLDDTDQHRPQKVEVAHDEEQKYRGLYTKKGQKDREKLIQGLKEPVEPPKERQPSPPERPVRSVEPGRGGEIVEKIKKPETHREIKFTGNREALEEIAKSNITKVRERILNTRPDLNDEKLHNGAGDRISALLKGEVEEYIRLVQSEAGQKGDENFQRTLKETYFRDFHEWLLRQGLTEDELKKFLGQAYTDLGFDQEFK